MFDLRMQYGFKDWFSFGIVRGNTAKMVDFDTAFILNPFKVNP